ncbi:MAG: hypothetical protein EOO09_08360 [Chitinophagaceae bacterium]|nr:MAG: hypothetical protein EOO09_08360 [Chitinophagaceae bacterium]
MKTASFLLITALTFTATAASAQSVTDSTGATDSTAVPAAEPARSTFTLGASYMNNASYYGQKAAEKTPYVALVASYRHKSGLYLNALGYRLLNDSSTLGSAYGLGAGYEFRLSKHLSADLSYSYSFFPKLSPFLQAASPHNTNATITHKGWMNTSIGVDYTFGKTNDVFGTLGFSKEITLFNPSEKDVVSLSPSVEVIAGTQRFYEYYVEEKRTRDSLLGLPIPPIFGGGNGGGSSTTTTTKEKTSIDLLSYNLKLPLSYSRAHYTLELAYQVSLLGDKAQTGAGNVNSFFGASFYYQF